MIVRDTTVADLAEALALNNANIPAVNELDAGEIARLHGFSVAALTAEVDGRFAGFCFVYGPGEDYASYNYGWFSQRYTDFVYLDRIAVGADFRRFGIGRAFYAELVQRFSGVRPVLLCEVNTKPRNETSLQFHHTIGFREVGTQVLDGGAREVSMLELQLP